MSEFQQQQLSTLSRQMGQLTSRLVDSERQRVEEAANATAMQAAQKAKEDRWKGREVQDENIRMFFLLADQGTFEWRSGTTAASSRADRKQQQDKPTGYVLQTGWSGEPDSRREPTRRGLLDRLGLNSNAYGAEDSFGSGEGDAPGGFGFAEDQLHPEENALSDSSFEAMKGVKWQMSVFDGKTTSWRRFEMKFLLEMRHLLLDSVRYTSFSRRLLFRGSKLTEGDRSVGLI